MNQALNLHSIVVATSDQVSCPLGGESAVLNLKNSVYYGLDPLGTRIWDLLREPRSVCDMRDALLSEYAVDAEQCEQHLLDFLKGMLGEGLIDVRKARRP